jgi:hypothetical protein
MKKLLFIVMAICMIAVNCWATTNQFRQIIHSFTPSDSSRMGWGGWFIIPDLGNPNPNVLMLFGPRLSSKTAWVEFLGGTMLSSNKTEHLFDIRAFTKQLPVHIFAEGRYSTSRRIFLGFQTGYPIRISRTLVGKIGSEGELFLERHKVPIVQFGPNGSVPLGMMTIGATYFFNNGTGEIVRFYAIFTM